jgi:hypothetical protein
MTTEFSALVDLARSTAQGSPEREAVKQAYASLVLAEEASLDELLYLYDLARKPRYTGRLLPYGTPEREAARAAHRPNIEATNRREAAEKLLRGAGLESLLFELGYDWREQLAKTLPVELHPWRGNLFVPEACGHCLYLVVEEHLSEAYKAAIQLEDFLNDAFDGSFFEVHVVAHQGRKPESAVPSAYRRLG